MNPVHTLLFIITLLCCFNSYAQTSRIAIVIDDIGYRATDAEALTLPVNTTFSFLPHTPYGKKLALVANERQSDVLLHIPMEANNGKRMGPGGLHSSMNERSIRDSLQQSFDEIPFAIGINNHMGSLLTNKTEHMTWTMRYLKDNNRIFLDSRTSKGSVASSIAKQLGVPTLSRQVFLDNRLSGPYINNQFKQLLKVAKKKGSAIGIAHPHPESVKALTKLLATLDANNVELVPISQLYKGTIENFVQAEVTE